MDKKILIVHNSYQIKGGEDSVVSNELKLLNDNNVTTDTLFVSNDVINSSFNKLKYGLFSIFNPGTKKLLKDKINSFNPDIVHVHNFFPIISPSIFYYCRKKGIKTVFTIHNYRLLCANALFLKNNEVCTKCLNKTFPLSGIINKCYQGSLLNSLMITLSFSINRWIKSWSKIDKIICLSEFQQKMFLESNAGINKEQTVVKYNFIKELPQSSSRENFFLFIGRLSEEKGIEFLIKAFKKSKETLKIIGDGLLREQLEELSIGSDNIHFLGLQEKAFVMENLSKAKALVFPSLCFEGMPMTIIEAYSTGTPVIASDMGTMSTMVNENLGIKFETRNEQEFLKAIGSISNWTNEEFNRISSNCIAEFKKKYTEKVNFETLKDIYTNL